MFQKQILQIFYQSITIEQKVTNIIYVYQQTHDEGGESEQKLSNTLLNVIIPKKKSPHSGQYLLDLIRELQDIENNWAKLLKNNDVEIERAKKQKIDVEDDQAYVQCVALLDQEYETQEQKFSKIRRKMKVALQTVQEHIQICQTQKKQGAEAIQKLKAQIEQLQTNETNFGQKVKRKYQIRQKIDEYKKEVEASSLRLQAAKQKSYEQKNLYIETHQLQAKLVDALDKIEGDGKLYYQFRNREEKYRKLQIIIQKLHKKVRGGNQNVEAYLKEKISAMAHLRTSMSNLQQKDQQYNNTIQEQEFVIEGLKRRLQQQGQMDDDLLKEYQNRYENLYLSKDNDINGWREYKSYLQQVLKKDRIQPNLTEMKRSRKTFYHYEPQTTFNQQRRYTSLAKTPLTKSNYGRNYSYLKTQPHLSSIEEQQEDPGVNSNYKWSRNTTSQNSPIHRFHKDLPNEIPYDFVRLPKLGRSSVKNPLLPGKIKENTRKNINDSNVSFQSVNSEDALSGSFVSVDYHKK